MNKTADRQMEEIRFRMAFEQRLLDWRDSLRERDELVRGAYAAGVNRHRIFLLTGIARTTIQRILDGVSRETEAS